MPKKQITIEEIMKDGPVRDLSEKTVLVDNYMPYAMSVITDRAIPAIDGFKPSHRKLLYTMFRMGLLSGSRTKSANIAGQGMKLSPHGDAGIYETMVRLTQNNEALLMPFVDGKGNFGKVYSRDMMYAASRYTEAKLMPICSEFFSEIGKDAVNMVDNYDGTMKEPELLPTAFPNVLVSANMGIAVGMASNMPGFNFGEVCRATAEYIKHPDTDIAQLMPAPDFTTGGELELDTEEMAEIYRTGRGSFRIRSVYQVDQKARIALVTQIPYSTSVELIIEKIAELMKAGQYPQISDVRDESDLSGLKIAIDFKRGTDIDEVMKQLFADTPLADSFACNFNILVDGVPRVMGVREILDEWLSFRIQTKERVLRYERGDLADKLHLLEALEKILLDIDKAIEIIRKTETDALVITNLMKGFDIDEVQANFVANIRLRNLNKEFILRQTKDISGLQDAISDIDKILGSKDGVKKLIAKELLVLDKKYPSERRTRIIEPVKSAPVKRISGFIEFTPEGYVHSSSEGIEIDVDTEILVFSDAACAYKVHATEAGKKDVYIGSLAEMNSGEKMLSFFVLDPERLVAVVYETGRISLYKQEDYVTKQNRKMLVNAYSDKYVAVSILSVDAEDTIRVETSKGRKLPVKVADLSLQSRGSGGIQALRLRKGETVEFASLQKKD